jgi:hypothetical protein
LRLQKRLHLPKFRTSLLLAQFFPTAFGGAKPILLPYFTKSLREG